MKFYPRYVGDFKKKTAALTLTEKGAYTELLDFCYANEEALPAQLDRVWAIAGARTELEKKAVETVLVKFFRKNGRGWTHDRVEEEIAKWKTKSEKASASTKIRWQGKTANNA